jgi:thioredoxin reductase (NADPH)
MGRIPVGARIKNKTRPLDFDKGVLPLAIVGGGPAGLTAGLYAARAGIKAALLSLPGGGMGAATDWVANYPGFPDGLTGSALVERFRLQAASAGLTFIPTHIHRIRSHQRLFELDGDDHQWITRSVIIATGAYPVSLGVPGEAEYRGRGVSYCATCDGPFFRGKEIAVIGGGDSAIQEAIYLSNLASRVTVIHRRAQLRANQALQKIAFATPNIIFRWDSILTEISGGASVTTIRTKCLSDGQVQSLDVQGVFLYVGLRPNSQLVAGLVDLDSQSAIITERLMETSVSGLFAAGDVRNTPLRQFITSCADGAIAAQSALHFLKRIESDPAQPS